MVKRCIGIDIGSSCICAVQVMRTDEGFCVEKVLGTQIRRSTDSPGEVLRLLFNQHGFDRRAEVAISMPHDAVFFRNLETDSAGLEQIREGNWSALEHNFPVGAEEIVAQVYSYNPTPDGKYSVLTAVSTRQSLHDRLNIFTEAKLHPGMAEAAIFAVHSTVAVNHPEIMAGQAIIAYIDGCYLTLAIIKDNDIVLVRSIPVITESEDDIKSIQKQMAQVISREAQVTWQKVFGADIEQNTKIYLVSTGQISEYLVLKIGKKLRSETTVVDCYATVENLSGHMMDIQVCVAEGLALRLLAPEQTKGINFLEADKADAAPALNLRKEVVFCAALISAIAVFLLVGLFTRLSNLESAYARIKNETTEIFQATIPDEKNIVNPLVQLEQKIESFRDSRLFTSFSDSGLSPLDALYKISVNSSLRENIKIDDILIAADTVRINGTCDSFEPVYQWQQLLLEDPGFTSVDVKDIQKQSKSGAVHFTMLLSLSTQEPK
ncbi:MAG: pilus assembly protein PilM [Planctomycetes bacterium]|nr:pilus assembly protein PilM [Planctomycetota bacterium]